MNGNLETYYRRRASEYDAVYRKPERRADIARLGEWLRTVAAGRRVLEVAAGTGFRTEQLALVAGSILATDAAEETLAIARRRDYGKALIEFAVCDAFALDTLRGRFDAGVACFWISHVPRDRITEFVRHLCQRLEPGARVVLADNRYVEGSNHPITRTDQHGNTFQRRALTCGEEFEVLKNFPTVDELHDLAVGVGAVGDVVTLEYYWLLWFDLPR